jgi:hypothetical protein
MDETTANEARVLAHSPGRYPILVVDETGYDPEQTKPVTKDWLRENAIGRHSFVEVDPPYKLPVSSIRDYVRRKVLEGP